MNIIKILRKPYFAILLASLTLFASCSQYDNEINIEHENVDLETFVSKHLVTSTEIITLMKQEKNINFDGINEITNSNISLEELKSEFKSNNVKQFEQLAHLMVNLLENSNNFVKSNSVLNKTEINNLVILEIDKQLLSSDLNNRIPESCQQIFDAADATCVRNFAISGGISAIGLLAGGIVGGIGLLAAIAVALDCNATARENLNTCLGN